MNGLTMFCKPTGARARALPKFIAVGLAKGGGHGGDAVVEPLVYYCSG